MRQRVILFLLLALVGLAARAQAQLPVLPDITTPVSDEAGVLDDSEEARIAGQITALREQTGAQFAALLVRTTGSEPIEDYAHRVATAWGGGDKERDDGILFVLAIDDRRMRLEVGYGLEAKLPDSRARSIIDSLKPDLREQKYDRAVETAIAGVASALSGAAPSGPLSSVGRREAPFGEAWFVLLYPLALALGAASATFAGTAYRRHGKDMLHVPDEGAASEDGDDAEDAPKSPRQPPIGGKRWLAYASPLAAIALVIALTRDAYAVPYAMVVVGGMVAAWLVSALRRGGKSATSVAVIVVGLLAMLMLFGTNGVDPDADEIPGFLLLHGIVAAVTTLIGWAAAQSSGSSSTSSSSSSSWSFSSSSSSWGSSSSSSSFSSSSSSSSSWSGGGGSFGGGGASSSW